MEDVGQSTDMLGAKFPPSIRQFIDKCKWTFAKTMPEWPHEYIVRARVDEELFVRMVSHIRANGYKGWFYRKPITYFDEGGLVYWTMGSPIPETTIINRTRKELSYEYKIKNKPLTQESAIPSTWRGPKPAEPQPEPIKDLNLSFEF
jgi:hypothetical protein